MIRISAFALALCLSGMAAGAQDSGQASPPPRPADAAQSPGAVLRALDKVSGETTDLTIRVHETKGFGKLDITLSDCRFPAEDPTSNAWAHLTIVDSVSKTTVFSGWMIAASPALSALDHPRYDVWVLSCTTS
jgi:hypothetical protein